MMVRVIACSLLVLGVLFSQVYTIGSELHRMYVPVWFFIGALSLCAILPSKSGVQRTDWALCAGLILLVLYYAVRGMLSEVAILAHKDFLVLGVGVAAFWLSYTLSECRRYGWVIMGMIVLVHLCQTIGSLLPTSLQDMLPQMWGELKGQKKDYGFFRHYNPFASYCGINLAWISVLAFIPFHGRKRWLVVSLGAALLLLTLLAAYYSGSRMGLAVCALTSMLSICAVLGCKFVNDTTVMTRIRRVSVTLAAVLVLGGGALGVFNTVFSLASEQRGMRGDLYEDVMGGMRIGAIGMGYSLWQEAPVLGNGARAYYYESPRLRMMHGSYSPALAGHPDAEMVHNDYFQTLAEYGVVGLVIVLLVVLLILGIGWYRGWRSRYAVTHWFLLPIVMTAAVVGVMVHSLGDFPLHNMSVFTQLSLVLGLSLGLQSDSREQRDSVYWPRLVSIVVVLVGVFTVAGRHLCQAPLFWKYDYAKWCGTSADTHTLAMEIARKSPEPFILEKSARALLRERDSVSAEERAQKLDQAEYLMSRALEQHPYRLPVLVNQAFIKVEKGEFDQAESLISQAFDMSNERWKAYEVGRAAELYLFHKGQELWFSRQAPLARAYFEKALLYNMKGKRGLRNDPNHLKRRKRIQVNLKILDKGGIQAQEGSVFFGGRGL